MALVEPPFGSYNLTPKAGPPIFRKFRPSRAVIQNLAARFRNQLIAAANGQKHPEPICRRLALARFIIVFTEN